MVSHVPSSLPATDPRATLASIPYDKLRIRTYDNEEEYLGDARPTDVVILYLYIHGFNLEKKPREKLPPSTMKDSREAQPDRFMTALASSEQTDYREGTRVVVVGVKSLLFEEKHSATRKMTEFQDKLLGMGFPKRGLRVVAKLRGPLHVHRLVGESSRSPSGIGKGVLLATGFEEVYQETNDNWLREKEVERKKMQLMLMGTGDLVNAGWHVMSFYPETREKVHQIIEFLLSDKDYMYDPIFRFPPGYKFLSGEDDVTFTNFKK